MVVTSHCSAQFQRITLTFTSTRNSEMVKFVRNSSKVYARLICKVVNFVNAEFNSQDLTLMYAMTGGINFTSVCVSIKQDNPVINIVISHSPHRNFKVAIKTKRFQFNALIPNKSSHPSHPSHCLRI